MLGTSLIMLPKGREKMCRELCPGDLIHSIDHDPLKIIDISVIREERGMRIATNQGGKITLSRQNIVLTKAGPKLAKDLNPTDLLITRDWGESTIAHLYLDPIVEKIYNLRTETASWIYVNGIAVADMFFEKKYHSLMAY